MVLQYLSKFVDLFYGYMSSNVQKNLFITSIVLDLFMVKFEDYISSIWIQIKACPVVKLLMIKTSRIYC